MPLDTEAIRRSLTERRGELARRARHIQADRRHERGALDRDAEEQAVERENDEVLDGLDDHVRDELDAIDRALARIDEGSFGTCTVCGGAIDPRRLEALPTAEACRDCAA